MLKPSPEKSPRTDLFGGHANATELLKAMLRDHSALSQVSVPYTVLRAPMSQMAPTIRLLDEGMQQWHCKVLWR